MRAKTLKLATIRAAWKRGQKVSETWQAVQGHDQWHARQLEIARLPEVWDRIQRRMAEERCHSAYKAPPVPLWDLKHKLPGYVLTGWNSQPREGWDWAHNPGTAWDGVRRNVYASLPETLDMLVSLLEQGRDVEWCRDELWNRWRVRVK